MARPALASVCDLRSGLDAYQEWLAVDLDPPAGSVVDGGEEGGVGADQGGVL